MAATSIYQQERALAHAQRAIEMRPARAVLNQPGGLEMKNEGLSDRAEKLMMGIPAVLVGLLVAALFWSGCERAAAPRIPESAPIIIPISPDEALDKSEAEATGRVNRGLSQSDMNHWLPKAVATRIGSAFRAKGWVIDEHPGSHGDVWLTFSWPEGKP